jgi:hypothetical protein
LKIFFLFNFKKTDFQYEFPLVPVSIGAAAGFILIVFFIIFLVILIKKKKKNGKGKKNLGKIWENFFLEGNFHNNIELKEKAEIMVELKDIKKGNLLGIGNFGEVYQGILKKFFFFWTTQEFGKMKTTWRWKKSN